jgi:hypothetical protein
LRLEVEWGDEAVEVRRAASCLIRPQIGDEVLCAADLEKAFVLAVLTRAAPEDQAFCDLPRKTSLNLAELTLNASRFGADLGKADIEAGRLTLGSDHLAIGARLFRLGSKLFSAAFGSFLGKAKDARLKVEDTAAIEADSISLASSRFITARAEGIDLKADGPVSIDGRHLRLG